MTVLLRPARIRRQALVGLAAASAIGLAVPAVSTAYIAPGARIVSASLDRLEQADDTTTQVALSGDGRYAAFTTRARNFFDDADPDPVGQFRSGGIFRRDLEGGGLQLVAHGDLRSETSPDTPMVRGALNPSLSGDGRFVAFSTAWKLSPDDQNGNADVYVRDMTVPIGTPGAYELVSRSTTGAPARYAALPEGQDHPGVNPGTDVTGRAAISADGQTVVFKTADVVSDLPTGDAIDTPGQQVFVRNRRAGTTTLVTRDRTSGAPAGGALGAAVLSADGSTVAWVGRNAPAQTAFLVGEGENPAYEYYLWRKVADGPAASTRRVTGYVDPEDPGCAPGTPIIDSPVASGPCYGPLSTNEGLLGGIVGQAPALSADGMRVAYLTNASARGVAATGNASDVFVTDMTPGKGRKATTFEVTRDGGPTTTTSASIDGIAMSADGRWLALTTLRTTQVTQILRVLGTSRLQATARDVQLVDLTERTIERASIGIGGSDTDGPASAIPALSADGRRVAFISSASNLFFGDANNRPDAFVVERTAAAVVETPAEEIVSEVNAPAVSAAEPAEVPPTRLVVRAGASRKGVVTIRIKVPEKAQGLAAARGRLRNTDGKRVGGTRVLARSKVRATKATTVTVRLKLPKRFKRALKAAGKLTASTQVTLTGASGRSYVGRVTVEFKP